MRALARSLKAPTSLLLGLGLVVLWACPGTLDDPERFRVAPCGGPGELPCTSTAPPLLTFFRPQCGTAGCHAPPSPQSGLDLASEGLNERVMDVVSASGLCPGQSYVVPGVPEQSLIYTKMTGTPPPCGTPMPPGVMLVPEDVQAVHDWIEALGRLR
ncbi:MAG: hypothetical protein IT384_05205 [Deltaproteobacteria bacterium]|nr:hypothetical protein [Deltaproteobacteria bacterium]